MNKVMEWAGKPNVADFLPFLKWLDPMRIKRNMVRDMGECMKIISGVVKERVEEKQSGREKMGKDLLDVLMEYEGDEKEGLGKISERNVIIIILVTPFEIEREFTPLGINACSLLGPSNGQVIKVLHKAFENESNGNTIVMEVTPNGVATVVAGCSVPSDVYVVEWSADISVEIPTAKSSSLGMALDNSEGTRCNEAEPSNLAELMRENELLRTMVETNRKFDQGVLNH
ncbi:unnamed protein product [Ilex paraguariensis]|uniref:Uncharacterized protein n=1 Tax=Ilex paraguariensis TaxID=185542 RepID=A0ABC8T158_9AQUA